MMDGLPKSVRVGPHDIRFVKLSKEDEAQSYGQWSERDLAIELSDKYAAGSMAAETVVHELLHAMWFAAGLKGEADEERIVTRMSTLLTQNIRDNPKLWKWIRETVGK
jgi:hypothetical protein